MKNQPLVVPGTPARRKPGEQEAGSEARRIEDTGGTVILRGVTPERHHILPQGAGGGVSTAIFTRGSALGEAVLVFPPQRGSSCLENQSSTIPKKWGLGHSLILLEKIFNYPLFFSLFSLILTLGYFFH